MKKRRKERLKQSKTVYILTNLANTHRNKRRRPKGRATPARRATSRSTFQIQAAQPQTGTATGRRHDLRLRATATRAAIPTARHLRTLLDRRRQPVVGPSVHRRPRTLGLPSIAVAGIHSRRGPHRLVPRQPLEPRPPPTLPNLQRTVIPPRRR